MLWNFSKKYWRMEPLESKLIYHIELCLLRKLARNVDECDNHTEYELRLSTLDTNFPNLLQILEQTNLTENSEVVPEILASLLMLFHELRSDGVWNTEKCKHYSDKLNQCVNLLYGVSLEDILLKDNIFNIQDIFNACLASLCGKLNSSNFKRHPGQIEVYCALMMNIHSCQVKLNPLTALPISLLLMEDYLVENKIKGLKCCVSILKCLSPNDFNDGNFYEVLYQSLNKLLPEKDIEITKLISECLLEFIRIVPNKSKENIISEMYSATLEQLMTGSNLYRKATLFHLTKDLISLCGVNCVKKKNLFKNIICDNLEVCCTEAVGDILLEQALESLTEWLSHCWCVWKFSDDHRLLSILLKLLYASKDHQIQGVLNVIATLIELSTVQEQQQIMRSLDQSTQMNSEKFQERIELLKTALILRI